MLLTTRIAPAGAGSGPVLGGRAAAIKAPISLSRLRERDRVRAALTRSAAAGSISSAAPARLRLLGAAFGALRPAGVLLGILLGVLDEKRAHHVLHRIGPVRALRPLRPVPLGDEELVVAVVVLACHLDGRGEALHAELLQPRLGDVERLEPGPHVLAGDDLPAADALRVADRLGDEHRVVDAAIVEHLADLLLRRLREPLVDDVLLDLLDDREIGAGEIEAQGLVALALGAAGAGVVVTAGPPDADELADREAGLDRLLDGGWVHGAPALVVEPVGAVAADVEPDRALILHVLGGDRIELQLEAVVLGELLEERDRLLAEGRVEVDEADLLAFELVEPAFLLGHVLDEDRGAVPVGVGRVEDPGEDVA